MSFSLQRGLLLSQLHYLIREYMCIKVGANDNKCKTETNLKNQQNDVNL